MTIEKEVAFDPYHKWLGIPKAQRPPTHYQLLGLAQGETDTEVIEEAAIRQTTHLRAYQVGPHADDCTRLLNEISVARQVLVNPQKRHDYDQKLAQIAAKRAAAAGGNDTKIARPIEVESAFADFGNEPATPVAVKPRREASKPGKPTRRPAPTEAKGISQTVILGAAAGGGVLIVGLVALIAFLVSPAPVPVVANNGQPKPPPVVVNPPVNPPVNPGVDPNPKPPVDPNPNKVDPPPIVPFMRPLGSFSLRTVPKNLTALADGRVVFGATDIHFFDPGHNRALQPMAITNAGPRGFRFAVAPDGKTVYVSTPDNGVLAAFRLYGPQIASLKPAGEINAIGISPDGSTLATATYDGYVTTWNPVTHERMAMAQSHGRVAVESAVFSRDGSLLATATDKSILNWNVREKRVIGGASNFGTLNSMQFTPDGQTLLVASSLGLRSTPVTRTAWSGVKTGGKEGILRIAFVNDKMLAVLRADGPEVYEWPSMKPVRQAPVASNDCETLAVSPDGRILFVGLASSKLLAFAIEDEAVLKPYVPAGGTPMPPPPTTGPNSYVGAWHYETKPTGSTKMDLVVRNVNGTQTAQLDIMRTTSRGHLHVDVLRLDAGKLRGPAIIDAPPPTPWNAMQEIALHAPVGESIRVEMRTDKTTYNYTFYRADATEIPPPKVPTPPVPPKTETIVRVDVPSEEKIKDVTAAVHDNFKAEYAKKSAADRIALAEKLLQLAAETKDDSAARYVLFCEARDLGAAAGKWSIVADAFEQLDAGFKVDLLPQREAALQTLVKAGLNKEAAVEATEAALQGISDAVAADKVTLASDFAALAKTASAKSLSVPHISLVNKADAELKIIVQESDAAKKARDVLKTTPDDPAANLAVGRYDALRRHDWDSALARLAKGGDGELPALARKEIAAPTDGPGQKKIGDEWWAMAEKEKDSSWVRAALQNRGAHWYRLAASQVTGLALLQVHERLKTIDEAPSPFHLGIGGASAALRTFTGHKGPVTALHLMADGKRLISGSLDSTVRSWDLKTGKGLANQMPQPVYSIAYSPSARYLAVGFKDTMKVLDTENPTSTARLASGNAWPSPYWADDRTIVSISATGISTSTVTGGGSGGPNPMRGNAIVWSPAYFKFLVLGEETWIGGASEPPPGFPRSTFPSLRNKTLLTDSTCAAFSPTQQVAAVATADKKIQLLDLQSRNVTTTFDGSSSVTRCLAYLPTGDRLLSGGEDGIVRIWDVTTGKEVRHFSTGSKGVSSLIVTPDGKQIITGGIDGVIRFWAMPRDKGMKSTAANRPSGPQSQLASASSPLVEVRMALLPRDGMSWMKAS